MDEEEIVSALENNGMRIENLQEDVVYIGIAVGGLLLAILIVGIIALYHFW